MANPDVFTIGAILILIVGAACFYLYTRIKQVEKKVALVEGILLDLKMAAEASFLDFPARRPDEEEDDEDEDDEDDEETPFLPTLPEEETDLPIDEEVLEEEKEQPTKHIEITEFKPDADDEIASAEITPPVQITKSNESVTPDLEALSVKELQALAKSKGITVGKTMRKHDIIKAINSVDAPKASELIEQFATEPDGISATSSLMTAGSLNFVTLDE